MVPSRHLPAGLAAVAATALLAAVPSAGAVPAPAPAPVPCNPDVSLLSYTDALNKTTAKIDGTDQSLTVGGLSALVLGGSPDGNAKRTQAWALVDNQGTTPARIANLTIDDGAVTAKANSFTQVGQSKGLTGQNFDGEGLVRQSNGRFLASSETEPSIYRLDDLGRVLGKLPVPDRFRVAPAGQATTNLTFEGLGLSPDGHTLWAGMEGPLSGDGLTADNRARLRFLRYQRTGTDWSVAGQVGYLADPGLGVSEVQVVN
ncbi:MAG TPA: esterase-like activity of phytase family protein, partial [Baekduia sp.]|nr:esterase-like activity of phytase family protein [Baekduia sp.]